MAFYATVLVVCLCSPYSSLRGLSLFISCWCWGSTPDSKPIVGPMNVFFYFSMSSLQKMEKIIQSGRFQPIRSSMVTWEPCTSGGKEYNTIPLLHKSMVLRLCSSRWVPVRRPMNVTSFVVNKVASKMCTPSKGRWSSDISYMPSCDASFYLLGDVNTLQGCT